MHSFLGATFILSFGWQPLIFNALLYLILTIILLVNRQNAIRPIAIIPIFGIVGSFSYHPLLRNFDSLDFIFPNDSICPSCIISANHIPNKNARVIYTQYKDGHRE